MIRKLFQNFLLAAWIILGTSTYGICQTKAPVRGESTELEPVVVTGTAYPKALSSSTASVTIITKEEIRAGHSDSVIDVLRQIPGLYIDMPGARGGVSSVYIRGGDPNFTLVLIDGIKVNDPANSRGGSFDFSTLSTDNIERIEIVRAPLSALYGSDAMSGVINIITHRGKAERSMSFEASGGSFGRFRHIAQADGLKGRLDYALSASYLDDGEPVEGSAFIGKTLNSKFGFLISENMEIRSTLRYTDIESETFPDDSGGPEFAVIRSTEERDSDQLTLGFDLTHSLLHWWQYRLKAGTYKNDEEIFSPGVAPGLRDPFGIPSSDTDSSFTRYEMSLINRFSLWEEIDLAIGIEGRFENGSSRGSLIVEESEIPSRFDLERDVWAAFLEARLSPVPNLLILLGVRLDFPEEFDHEISPRVGASYSITATGTTIRGSWGEGFKLPSFFALGNPLVGNPDLEPEKSRSFDAGIAQNLWKDRISIGATYFYNEFSNAVDFEEGPPPRLVNRSEISSQGFEFNLNLLPSETLRMKGHLTYVDTNIKGTNEELRNRPEWFGGFSVWWRLHQEIEINLDAVFVGEVLDSSIPTGDVELDSYARFDLALTWKPHKNLNLFLVVENLFDADYEQFIGFPAPRISPRGGIQARF